MSLGAQRRWLLVVLVVGIWWGSAYLAQPHRVLGRDAPATDFSARRARIVLARVLGAQQRRHPLSSDANDAVRVRILRELASLGLPAQTLHAFTCNAWRGFSYVPCASVTDIVAQVLPGRGPAILMVAHYDSVPAGPGASDDGSGVAALLEAARALRAGRGAAAHPVLALWSDGEEPGLLGAHAFLQAPAWRGRVGAVVNLDARGTSGSSLLYQTSPGDAALIDLYAAHVPQVATSSLYASVYRRLPNDTDLTLFLRAGYPSFNFAFARDERYYHTPRDDLSNLNSATLQMQGDSLLGVVRGLEQAPLERLRGGHDAVYLSVLNAFVMRWPLAWALPVSLAVLAALAGAGWLARERPSGADSAPSPPRPLRPGGARSRRRVPTPLVVPALVLAAVTGTWLLTTLARWLADSPDAGSAHPAPLRLAIGAGVWSVLLLLARGRRVYTLALSVWLWMAGLGVLCAVLLPGCSPYFVLPALIAALSLLASARRRDGWSVRSGQWALLIAALAALVVWEGLADSVETLLGVDAAVLAAGVLALGLTTLLPLLATPAAGLRSMRDGALLSGAVALLAAVVAGALPAHSVASPERVNLIYLQDEAGAHWIADSAWNRRTPEPLPERLRAAGPFRLQPLRQPLLGLRSAYVAAASDARLPLPALSATVSAPSDATRVVTLQWQGSADTDAMLLSIPAVAHLQSIEFRGQNLRVPPDWHGDTRLVCASRDCRRATLTLQLAAQATAAPEGPWQLQLAEQRYALPAFGAALQAARPPTAIPTQSGDQTVLVRSLMVQ